MCTKIFLKSTLKMYSATSKEFTITQRSLHPLLPGRTVSQKVVSQGFSDQNCLVVVQSRTSLQHPLQQSSTGFPCHWFIWSWPNFQEDFSCSSCICCECCRQQPRSWECSSDQVQGGTQGPPVCLLVPKRTLHHHAIAA